MPIALKHINLVNTFVKPTILYFALSIGSNRRSCITAKPEHRMTFDLRFANGAKIEESAENDVEHQNLDEHCQEQPNEEGKQCKLHLRYCEVRLEGRPFGCLSDSLITKNKR